MAGSSDAVDPLWTHALRGGAHWSGVLRRGVSLRMTARAVDANVAALFYSHEQPLERYNMADTLKAQHTAHLTAGCVCYSDMGRVLCAITADSCGWHDPLCGLTDAADIEARYGRTSYQAQRNERYVSGRDAMLVEMGPRPAKTAEGAILEAIPIQARHFDIRHATGSIPVDEHLLGYVRPGRLRFPDQ